MKEKTDGVYKWCRECQKPISCTDKASKAAIASLAPVTRLSSTAGYCSDCFRKGNVIEDELASALNSIRALIDRVAKLEELVGKEAK